MRVLVTGASGFIGRSIVAELQRRMMKPIILRRHTSTATYLADDLEVVSLSGPGTEAADWANAIQRCDSVIHLAARAHVLRDLCKDPEKAFYSDNVLLTRACGVAAARAGVKRFVFMSSIGVHGGSSGKSSIRADNPIAPHSPYARSKADAERALTEITRDSRMELTVVRPPLVYGFGAPGNFGSLLHAIKAGWLLPFGMVTDNRRSFVAIDNLVDLVMTCLNHPAAANKNFLVSDGEDLSTADLLRRLGVAMGRPARLIPVPVGWLALGAKLLGRQEMFQSLATSLQVDICETRQLLGWNPPIGVNEGLKRAVGGIAC